MFTRSKHAITAMILGAAALSQITPAQAVPTIRLTSGTTVITIADGGSLDQESTEGAISFIGVVGDFNLNFVTGVSHPAIGDGIRPEMHLNSFNISGAVGTIRVEFSDNDWSTGMDSHLIAKIGGIAAGSISYSVYTGADNELFSYDSLITTQGPYSSYFSGSEVGTVAADDLYSITLDLLITHDSTGDHSSLDAIILVPEPVTLAIFGFGLLGLGAATRRRSNNRHRLTVYRRSKFRPNRLRSD